ncbi:type VI secretion system baseplate subunit TssF [Paraburkholderia sp.]|uniref:type VI secretion system baseplate subunit TssF n=1 Tax=Paraburkholderia sp. TaxID=1926495 RepID=UPI003D6E9944
MNVDDLLPHYEYELGLFVRALTEFAVRYPKIATRLGIESGRTDDMHVERLIQTFAFVLARIDSKVADDYPEFTEALLEIVYPHYLRAVPSCAMVQFDPKGLLGQLTAPFAVPRGTMLNARTAPCRFRSVYDVTLSPLRIHSARYAPTTLAPSKVNLPPDATGLVSITFASAAGRFTSAVPDGPVRIHLSGERPFVATLLDTLQLRSLAAYVEVDDDGRWHALSTIPIEVVGLADDERLLPQSQHTNATAFSYLLEYFAFPEMFDFVDIDLGRIRRAARAPDARMLTLHVAVRDTPVDSPAAAMLGSLDERAFRLFCTPIVNLFRRTARSIVLTGQEAHPIHPEPLAARSPIHVYSIDAVHLGAKTDSKEKDRSSATDGPRRAVPPYRAFGHGHSPEASDIYWVAFRDVGKAGLKHSRSLLMFSLVGLDGHPTRPAQPQVDIETTATNGDLPSHLPIGNPLGDLLHEGGALACPVTLLTRPTLPAELPRGNGALWRVLSTLSRHPIDLTRNGLSALKELLRLHAARTTPLAQSCVDAITDLNYRSSMRWMSLDSQFPSFVRGIEIVLSFDEGSQRDVNLGVFAKVLERFFAPYGSTNSFVQLVICSTRTGKELVRGAAFAGTQSLI